MLLNFNQPLRGTTRPRLPQKAQKTQGSKSSKSVDALCAKVTHLFVPYMRDISDNEFILLCQKLAKLLTPVSDSLQARGGES